MKIVIIHTTRSRPEIAYNTADAWLSSRSSFVVDWTDIVDLTYHVGVEASEAEEYEPYLLKLREKYPNQVVVKMFEGKRIEIEDIMDVNFQYPNEEECKGYLTANTKGNALIKNAEYDWLICVADNFFPPENWLTRMYPYFERLKHQIALFGYECQLRRRLVSHAICTKEFIEWNGGYLMYDGYYHTHGDSELFLKASMANCLYGFPAEFVPDHRHAYKGTAPKDELCIINNAKRSYDQADPIFKKRQKELIDKYAPKTET